MVFTCWNVVLIQWGVGKGVNPNHVIIQVGITLKNHCQKTKNQDFSVKYE